MSTITINNLSVSGAGVANDIGGASGADTPAKVKTIIGTTDAELLQLENITASGLDGLPDGAVYKRTTVAGANDANSIGAASGAAVADRLLTLIKTVDGAGSGLDADLLDGKNLATTSASGVVVGTLGTGKIDNSFLNSASTTVSGISSIISASGIVTGTDNTQFITASGLRGSLAIDGAWLVKRTKLPDGASAGQVLYSKAAGSWTNTDGWDGTGTESIENGNLKIVVPTSWSTATTKAIAYDGSFPAVLLMRVNTTSPNPIIFTAVSGGETLLSVTPPAVGVDFVIAIPWVAFPTAYVRFRQTFTGGGTFYLKDIYFGAYTYASGSLTEEGAAFANEGGDAPGTPTKAQATLTSTGTAPSDGDTVTIAGKVYTAKTVLGTTEGNVLIGDTANAAAFLDNLKSAVNSTGVSAVQYCAAQNPLVEATTNTDTTQLFEARTAGLLGNQITIAESSSQLSWANPDGGTSTLSRGTGNLTQKILSAVSNYIAGSGTRPAAARIELTSTSLIGYEQAVDVASGGTLTLPAGGTWIWNVYGYGATISSAKRGSSAGGTTLTVAGANATVWYRRYA